MSSLEIFLTMGWMNVPQFLTPHGPPGPSGDTSEHELEVIAGHWQCGPKIKLIKLAYYRALHIVHIFFNGSIIISLRNTFINMYTFYFHIWCIWVMIAWSISTLALQRWKPRFPDFSCGALAPQISGRVSRVKSR